MNVFKIKKGTTVFAVRFKGKSVVITDQKVIKKQVLYTELDVKADPTGNLGDKSFPTAESFASEGFYGFQLPKNSKGYEMMYVHINDVTEFHTSHIHVPEF